MNNDALVRRILLLVLLAVNLAFLGVTAYSLFRSYQDHESQALGRAQRMAESFGRSIDVAAKKIELTLHTVADELERELAAKGLDDKLTNSFLDRIQTRVPELDAIRVCDDQGLVILGQGVDKSKAVSWADRDSFIYHRDHPLDTTYVSKAVKGRVAGKYILGFTQRYNYPDGRFAGVIAATIDISYLRKLIGGIDTGPNGLVILRDQDLGLITRVPSREGMAENQVGSQVMSAAGLAAMSSGRESAWYKTPSVADGLERIAYMQRLNDVPFILLVALATQDYLATWYAERYRMLALVLIFGLASVAAWRRALTMLTERDRLQTEVQEYEARLTVAVDLIGEGLWEWNMVTGEMPRSRPFDAALGYSEQDLPLTADAWVKLIHPEDLDRNAACLRRHLEEGSKYEIEMRVRAKDGNYRWVACRGTVVSRDAHGAPTRMSGLHTDITTRKQQEEQLKIFAKVIAETNDVVIISETEPLELPGPRIVFVNESFERVTGYTREEAIGNTPRMLQGPQPDRAPLDRIHRALKQWQPVRAEVLNYTKDGRDFWADLMIFPIADESGWFTHWASIQRDITENKQMFLDLVKAKEGAEAALAASHAKSTFLANMSHEIRTPMNGVIGMVDVLQETNLTPGQQRMLGTISHSSQALLTILNDILDFSKIEAGMLSVECIPTHLTEVLESVLQLMQISANTKSIDLSFKLAPELPLWVLTDPTRLRQVLLNLIGNALKFTRGTTERPGRVSVDVMSCQHADGQPALCIKVTDNGIGIKPEHAAKLFQPFTQADDRTARRFGGTGLGLSISQRLVELLGGRITLQSISGQGSTFTVELPLQAATAPRLADTGRDPVLHHAPTVPNTVPEPTVRHRILLAEDNETNRDVLSEQLRLLGFDAEMAEDGAQALEKWRSGRFALLLTDCQMPNMDGFELTSAIRAEEHLLTRLPIIAITGNAMQGEAQRCLDAGMDDYLSKPLRMRELGAMLAKWLPT